MADGETPATKSDLPVRLASAIVMVAITGAALWLGGWTWAIFIALIAIGVFYEWTKLAFAISTAIGARLSWLAAGVIYIAVGCHLLISVRAFGDPKFDPNTGLINTIMIIVLVIAVDVGAYFSGRTFGGPKIAPRISPSKTWSGLFGGAAGAALVLAGFRLLSQHLSGTAAMWDFAHIFPLLLAGLLVAAVAQAGDFFESWMKRKAGVKDSSNLIPGHGGLFDRTDGLLAVCFVVGVLLTPIFGFPL